MICCSAQTGWFAEICGCAPVVGSVCSWQKVLSSDCWNSALGSEEGPCRPCDAAQALPGLVQVPPPVFAVSATSTRQSIVPATAGGGAVSSFWVSHELLSETLRRSTMALTAGLYPKS